MPGHPDLAAEQAHIDRAYQRLDEMRGEANEALRAALAYGRGGGTYQTLVERDVLVANSVHRMSRLELGQQALCFGRIDRETRECFHIGRLAVADRDHEPLVVDWRAPAAEPFYRATGREPLGLTRRRHFLTSGRVLVEIEDEIFDGADGTESKGLSGPASLLHALERARTGRMHDIVATVQREQDEIIRAPLPGVLVVQGGPGTGKTAVALHRAAYLLYTHRFPLERQGLLVVGPNPVFMRYIEHVLPSLGENGVEMSTIGGLVRSAEPHAEDATRTTRLKGDPRMAQVLARAVRDRQRPLRQDLTIGFDSYVIRLPAGATHEIITSARRRPGPHNSGRRVVERLLLQHLYELYRRAVTRQRVARDAGGELADPDLNDFSRRVRRDTAVIEALERMWPVLTPRQLLRDLFGAPSLLALASRGILGPGEQRLLLRPRGGSVEEVAWTSADLPLLDEALGLLGSEPTRRGDAPEASDADPIRTFGHVIVDEAQDLTPMQLRMLARRSLSGSITLVGDVGQATGSWPPKTWDEILAHLPVHRGARVVELTVNYRTPAEIMDLAAGVLAEAIPEAVAPTSVRSTGEVPRLVAVDSESLPARVAAVATGLRESVSDGTVAVISPPSLVGPLERSLSDIGADFAAAGDGTLDHPITVLTVETVKGLEFDAVIVVEPDALISEATNGLNALYVALTRTTRLLALVHSTPLPDWLTARLSTARDTEDGCAGDSVV